MLPKKQFNSAVARLRAIATTPDLIQMLAHQLIRANDNGEHNELLALLKKASPQLEGKPLLDRRRAENYLAVALYGRNHNQIAHRMPKEDDPTPIARASDKDTLMASDASEDVIGWLDHIVKHKLVEHLRDSDNPIEKGLIKLVRKAMTELQHDRVVRCEGKAFFEAMQSMNKDTVESYMNTLLERYPKLPLGTKLSDATIQFGSNGSQYRILIKLSTYDTKDARYRVDRDLKFPDHAPCLGLVKGEVYIGDVLICNSETLPIFWTDLMFMLHIQLPIFCTVLGIEQDT